MNSPAYKYPENAWDPLPSPWVGRALRVGAVPELAVERTRGGEPKRRNQHTRLAATPDQEADPAHTPVMLFEPEEGARIFKSNQPSAIARAHADITARLKDPATHVIFC